MKRALYTVVTPGLLNNEEFITAVTVTEGLLNNRPLGKFDWTDPKDLEPLTPVSYTHLRAHETDY